MIKRNNPSILRIVWRLRAMYFFFYAGMGSLLPYLSPFFASHGISASLIGLLLSIQPLVGSVVPPLWGGLADRTHRTMPLLRLQFIALPVFVILLFNTHGILALVLSLAALSSFLTAVTPLLDHVAMGYVQADRLDYGRIRVFGSLGFSFANLCMGVFLISHPIHDLSWIYVPALLGALMVALVTRERHEDSDVAADAPEDLMLPPANEQSIALAPSRWQAWRPLWGFFIMLLVFSLTVPAYGSFYPLYILVNHLPAWLTSLSFSLSSGSEILTMPFASLLYARRGPRFLLTCSATAYIIRWLVLGTTHVPVLIVGVQALHGVAFGFFYTSTVMYLRAAVPRDRLATGQTLFAATAALGNVIGNLSGGVLFDVMGSHGFFLFEMVVAATAGALVWIIIKKPATTGDGLFSIRPT